MYGHAGPFSQACHLLVLELSRAHKEGKAAIIREEGIAEADAIRAKGDADASAKTAILTAIAQVASTPEGKIAVQADQMETVASNIGKTTGTVVWGGGILPTLPIGNNNQQK